MQSGAATFWSTVATRPDRVFGISAVLRPYGAQLSWKAHALGARHRHRDLLKQIGPLGCKDLCPSDELALDVARIPRRTHVETNFSKLPHLTCRKSDYSSASQHQTVLSSWFLVRQNQVRACATLCLRGLRSSRRG